MRQQRGLATFAPVGRGGMAEDGSYQEATGGRL